MGGLRMGDVVWWSLLSPAVVILDIQNEMSCHTHQRWRTRSSSPGRRGGLRCWRGIGPAVRSPCSPPPPSWASPTRLHSLRPETPSAGFQSCTSATVGRRSTRAAEVRPAHTPHGHWGIEMDVSWNNLVTIYTVSKVIKNKKHCQIKQQEIIGIELIWLNFVRAIFLTYLWL